MKDASNIRREIRLALAESDTTLAAVARSMGESYDRVVRVIAGYRKPKPGEVERIMEAIRHFGKA